MGTAVDKSFKLTAVTILFLLKKERLAGLKKETTEAWAVIRPANNGLTLGLFLRPTACRWATIVLIVLLRENKKMRTNDCCAGMRFLLLFELDGLKAHVIVIKLRRRKPIDGRSCDRAHQRSHQWNLLRVLLLPTRLKERKKTHVWSHVWTFSFSFICRVEEGEDPTRRLSGPTLAFFWKRAI